MTLFTIFTVAEIIDQQIYDKKIQKYREKLFIYLYRYLLFYFRIKAIMALHNFPSFVAFWQCLSYQDKKSILLYLTSIQGLNDSMETVESDPTGL